ncbi:MAG: PEP-utilizing enzyme, partial [Pseudomonadota bacterium]|nr:PEP-utilizing enzyme [Pseudomonadota bacterium]
MRQMVELRGQPASAGLAFGPIVKVDCALPLRQASGDPATEQAEFRSAVAASLAELNGLVSRQQGEGAGIVSFQVAMLEDNALLAPVLAAIGEGAAADDAWRVALDSEIEEYHASDDEYFRARAGDLKDLRDRVGRHLAGLGGSLVPPRGAILAGDDVAPTLFLETDWSAGGGLALAGSSPSSHIAMLARSRGVPMVVGLGSVALDGHAEAIVDGETGKVVLSPGAEQRSAFDNALREFIGRRERDLRFLDRPAITADGTPIEVLVNIASLDELDGLNPAHCDGIGLMRTEFLFLDGHPLPDEQAQYLAYRRLAEWAAGKPVTIRTLDAGGDKPIRGFTPVHETNPFLGLRGVRLTLARPEVFLTQLRALARAAVHGNIKVMLPMITEPGELERVSLLLDDAIRSLAASGIDCTRPPLGIMIEVPAAAIAPDLFAAARFFSIGSNDLTQYVTAAARGEASVA